MALTNPGSTKQNDDELFVLWLGKKQQQTNNNKKNSSKINNSPNSSLSVLFMDSLQRFGVVGGGRVQPFQLCSTALLH